MQPQSAPPRIKRRRIWQPILATLFAAGFLCWALIPPFISAKRSAAFGEKEKELKTVGDAMIAYEEDHDNRFPDFSNDVRSQLAPYLHDPQALQDADTFVWTQKLSGKRQSDPYDSMDQWVFYTPMPGSKMIVYCTASCYAKAIYEPFYDENMKDQDPFSATPKHVTH